MLTFFFGSSVGIVMGFFLAQIMRMGADTVALEEPQKDGDGPKSVNLQASPSDDSEDPDSDGRAPGNPKPDDVRDNDAGGSGGRSQL